MVDYSKQIYSTVEQIHLGEISNGKYFKRIFIFLMSIIEIKKYIKNNNVTHIIFDKLDAFIIYYLMRIIFRKQSEITKIIEVPDLKKINFEKSITAKFYRYFEKKWMNKYIDKLIVTSPEYYNAYYKNFYKNNCFVLENKPISCNLPNKGSTTQEFTSEILTLGLIGGLNRGKPTKALLDIVSKNNWLRLKVFGLGIDEKIIKEYASKFSNIEFYGKFNFFKDAAKIYSAVDVAYVVYDTTSISLNTKLALPNKLYECMYFEIPMIVSKDTYLAKRVLEDKIGVAIDFTNETETIDAFVNIRKNYNSLKDNFKKISEDKYIADIDYEEFIKFIIS